MLTRWKTWKAPPHQYWRHRVSTDQPSTRWSRFCSHGYTWHSQVLGTSLSVIWWYINANNPSQGIKPVHSRSKLPALKRLIFAGSLTASDLSQLSLSSDIWPVMMFIRIYTLFYKYMYTSQIKQSGHDPVRSSWNRSRIRSLMIFNAPNRIFPCESLPPPVLANSFLFPHLLLNKMDMVRLRFLNCLAPFKTSTRFWTVYRTPWSMHIQCTFSLNLTSRRSWSLL